MRKHRITHNLNQAIILCGGKGTRLWPITKKIPKPLIKINNKAFIEYLIFNLSRQNIKNIILICSYKYIEFKKRYHNKKLFNAHIKCFNEKEPKGTGGGLRLIKNKIEKYFVVINGDTFFDINIQELFKNYKRKKYYGIIATTQNNNKRYDFLHKKNENNYVNGGSYIFSRDIFKLFKKKSVISLEKDIFPIGLKKKKLQLKSYNNQNKFIDIGIHKDLKKSSSFLKKVFFKPALFLDRDGVINYDLGYVHKIKDFIWTPKIKKLIKYFNDKKYYVIVLTNQSGIGRGYYKISDVEKLHSWINNSLNITGGFIDRFYYSPYYKHSKIFNSKKYLDLRKPNNGMIEKACRDFNINLKNSLFIGDQKSDLDLAKKYKIKFYMLKKNKLNKILKDLNNNY